MPILLYCRPWQAHRSFHATNQGVICAIIIKELDWRCGIGRLRVRHWWNTPGEGWQSKAAAKPWIYLSATLCQNIFHSSQYCCQRSRDIYFLQHTTYENSLFYFRTACGLWTVVVALWSWSMSYLVHSSTVFKSEISLYFTMTLKEYFPIT